MTTRFVSYCSFTKLPCAWGNEKDIILCLQDAGLVAQPEPPCALPITTIEAHICQVFSTGDSCQKAVLWQYTFQYDSELLANPSTPLAASDIVGVFCKDCETEWIEEQISCALSGAEIPFTVTDTNSVDLTVTPTPPQNLSADVKISPDANNIISIHSNGLFAEIFFSVTTAQLNTLIGSSGLEPGATYEINDFVQGRIVAGAKVYVQATAVNRITSACSVLTTYDTKLWRGVYNIATNLLIELSDNQGNTCRQLDSIFFSCIEDFDWGNTCYTQCLLDNAYWLVDYGIVGAIISNIHIVGSNAFDASQLDMRGWVPGFFYDVTIETNYQVTMINNSTMNTVQFTSQGAFSNFSMLDSDVSAGLSTSIINGGTILMGPHAITDIAQCQIINGGTIDLTNMTGGDLKFNFNTVTDGAYITINNVVYTQIGFCFFTGFIDGGPFSGFSLYFSDLTNVNDTVNMHDCFFHASILTAISFNTISLVRNCEFTCGSTTTVTNGSDLIRVSNNMGTINTNGFDLTDVYVNGNVTANCTGANTGKARDYFNNSIV